MLLKLERLGYRIVKKNYEDMLSRFHLIPERYRVASYLTLNNIVTLKSGLEVTQGH